MAHPSDFKVCDSIVTGPVTLCPHRNRYQFNDDGTVVIEPANQTIDDDATSTRSGFVTG
jgi:hypothetical protein